MGNGDAGRCSPAEIKNVMTNLAKKKLTKSVIVKWFSFPETNKQINKQNKTKQNKTRQTKHKIEHMKPMRKKKHTALPLFRDLKGLQVDALYKQQE